MEKTVLRVSLPQEAYQALIMIRDPRQLMDAIYSSVKSGESTMFNVGSGHRIVPTYDDWMKAELFARDIAKDGQRYNAWFKVTAE